MTTRRLLVIGASTAPICGVREYASVTGTAFTERGVEIGRVWWERDYSWTIPQTIAETRDWLARVDRAVQRTKPDWIVWHYSPLTYGWHGLALLQPLVATSLSRQGVPVLGILHELAHDHDRRGWRGPPLAVSQRVALATVIRSCSAYVATTEPRLRWLESRRWLPRRPGTVLPVCSTIPEPTAAINPTSSGLRIGVFGFGLENARADVALSAVADLRARGREAALVLIGRGDEAAVKRWLALAEEMGCSEAVRVTGVLEPSSLAAELDGCDLAMVVDEGGPSARRTTLAAVLARGVPVLALDGPDRWQPLAEETAALLVPAEQFSAALAQLADDPGQRRELGERGRHLYDAQMSPDALAAGTLRLLERAERARRPSKKPQGERPLRVAMVLNRPDLQLRRARELERRFPPSIAASVSATRNPRQLHQLVRGCDAVYIVNAGRLGFPMAVAARIARKPVVVELGDPSAALYRAQGRGPASVAAGAAIDWLVGYGASGVVVRGRRLAEIVGVRVPWLELPDGVDLTVFRPGLGQGVRQELGVPDDVLLAGLVGSLRRSRTFGGGYGWDLIEALALLPDERIWGLVVGDGSGLPELRRRALELGVADRLITPGYVAPALVPRYVCALDVCISTQTNDAVGRSRTTAKLPEYLACDRYVLATAVGGALDVLPEEMLLPYEGSYDPAHPGRLAARLADLVELKDELRQGANTRSIARAHYDYDVLAQRLAAFLVDVASR